MDTIFQYLPRGNTLPDDAWMHRHRILLWFLALHLPGLLIFGLAMRADRTLLAECLLVPLFCLAAGYMIRSRRPASIITTAGVTWCSAALVVLSGGSIEAHFHFFIIIGFIALYQDWVPFLWNIVFTVVSHGIGSAVPSIKIFNHPAAQASPWVWSLVHGAAVLMACVGLVIFWRVGEEDQRRATVAQRVAHDEIGRRQFTSDLLVNLARRNQSMLYRQLDIINQLEEKERDPDALAELFKLDHLATRVRRNAESLMVLSGETPSRVWSAPVPVREVLQAAIAETEDLDRLQFVVDERLAVAGNIVTDLTHMLAELAENAVRFSPPETRVTISVRPLPNPVGSQLLTIEDWGVGMPPEVVQETNRLLAYPPEVDLSVSQRLGFHVVARLAQRHKIDVSLTPTPGTGLTAVVVLPPELFVSNRAEIAARHVGPARHAIPPAGPPPRTRAVMPSPSGGWSRSSRPVPRQSWRPMSAESMSPESPAADLSELAEIAVDQLNAAGSDSRERWDGWWAAEPFPLRNGNRNMPDSGAANLGPRPSMEGSSEPGGAGNFVATDVPPRAADNGAAARVPELNRRRPQSHLSPELLKPRPTPYKRDRPEIPDPRPTSEALSRYQASRQAAQSEGRQTGQPTTGGAR